MDYEASKFLIRHALCTIGYMLDSASGLARLATCFRHARPEERWRFQGIVVKYAVEMAMERHSNYFVQLVLDHGDIQFRCGLVYKLMMQFASLSLHPHGNYLVQHCVRNRRTGSPQHDLLPIVLSACNRQSIRELQGLVQTPPATFVLHTLLQTGEAVTHSRELTQNLERKINDLLWRARRYRR
ncbi:uncharacterized protein [Triticum aestivum]|uniref:uncharacterized protein n=1 Tax=Triticum aestivum TaxID=4565 RepID=UPI001D033FFF|nr:uncharacterized protein LOC123100097 [Triticum aestivum]